MTTKEDIPEVQKKDLVHQLIDWLDEMY